MKILYGKEARNGLQRGVNTCANVVKVSLGHKGKNVTIYNGHLVDIINDGVTIAKFVETKDETEMAGVRLAQQCAAITNQEAGDGTTTTLVLLQSFLDELLSDTQMSEPRTLRKEIEESVKKVLVKLEKDATKVNDIKDIENVATTSSLDPKIGKMIAEIFGKLGKEANITLEETRYNVLEHRIVDGYQFDSENKALYKEEKEEYKDIPVAVFKKKVSADDIVGKVHTLIQEKEEQLMVIAPDVKKDAIGLITKFNAKGEFRIALVQNKELNEEDLSAIGNKVKKAIVTTGTTTLIGGNKDTSEYVKSLKDELAKEESSFQKELLQRRISSLTNGVAIVTVGAQTDVAREELKLKVEDAINAAKTAYTDGLVKGGGFALLEAGKGELIEKIAGSVYMQICENAETPALIIPGNVVDSLLAVKSSLMSAASIATSILTTEAALIEEDDSETTTNLRPSE